MPSAHDVAREVRSLLPSAGRVKVQKLLYKDAVTKTTSDRVVSNGALSDWFGRFVAKPIADLDEGSFSGVDEMPELLRLLSELVS